MGQIIKIPSGRQEKSFATVQLVYDQLIDMGFDRSGTIISLGGSVVGDIAGYVAATYMRGVEFVQCPTSLLSMVDTSVGGKTSIDLPQGKNIIGVYKQPIKVIADVATLQTLPQVDFASGMAEVIKHGLVAESDLLEQIEHGHWEKSWDRSPSNIGELQRLVAQAIQVKINIVQSDPFEEGRRSILNLGHTFAYVPGDPLEGAIQGRQGCNGNPINRINYQKQINKVELCHGGMLTYIMAPHQKIESCLNRRNKMASSFLLSVKGKKQGNFKGETGKNQTEIPILGFSYGVISPRDPATGQATGKRQHKPITVYKDWGVISVQLFEALVTNETLTSVVITEMRADKAGKEENYMQIRLSNAFVTAIQIDPERLDDQPVWTNKEIESVSFVFERIEIENYINQSTATDDWEPRA